MDLSDLIRPTPAGARFHEPDFFVWCGSMAGGDDGRFHLYYSRWPSRLGFRAWVTHSEIAHAVADGPLGPFRFSDVALSLRGARYWDGMCTLNPAIHRFDGRYYLYYTGTTGDAGVPARGLNPVHRSNQRIGVAVADRPEGPWIRPDHPLIEPTPGFLDDLCCTNPAVTRRPDGGYLMVYKGVGGQPTPAGGVISHVVAGADAPAGPFTKQPGAIFVKPGVAFAAEDPFLWYQDGRFNALVKDMAGHFAGDVGQAAIVQFQSRDGLHWTPGRRPIIGAEGIAIEGGGREKFHRLERPFLYLEDGQPAVLLLAAMPLSRDTSFNVQIPLKHAGHS